MKLKILASAVLTAIASGAAADLLKDGSVPGTPSDLLLVVYDAGTTGATAGKTFLFNTGLSYGDIVTGKVGTTTFDLSADPNFQQIKAAGGNLKYNIVGGYSLANDYSNYDANGVGKPFSDPTGAQWGVLTTGPAATNFNGEFGNLQDTTANRIFAYWNAANVRLSEAGATTSAGPDSVLVNKGDPLAAFDLAWAGNFGGGGIANVANANVVNGIGEKAKFFWVTNTDFNKGTVVEVGTWQLSADKLVYAGTGLTLPSAGPNHAPVSNAGARQAVNSGATVVLDGSASSDPDNDPLTYAWTQESGPAASLTGANQAKAGFTASADGVSVFKLTVSDGKASHSSTVKVFVGPSITLVNVPTNWKVGQAQGITFATNQLKKSAKATFQFAKSSGTKFKTFKTIGAQKRALRWKPVKSNVAAQGVIKACVKITKKQLVCDEVDGIVVQPQAKKK